MSQIPYLDYSAGWDSLSNLLNLEFKQSREEGKDPGALDRLRHGMENMSPRERVDLHERILEVPLKADYAFVEPSTLEEIRRLRPNAPVLPAPDLDEHKLQDQLHGAWLGRCCGCALGKPPESFMRMRDPSSWEYQKAYLTAVSPDEWPLRDYFPAHSPGEIPETPLICPDSTRDQICFMESDDDIRYTVLGQILLTEKGFDFTTEDVAMNWFQHLPYRLVCTAETQAYRNLVMIGAQRGDQLSPGTIDWSWVVTHLNPYREWIGAQIRVDAYGYACPGNPELAAELAWRDARLSHCKNGIYGAMFCAAMIAASFVCNDPLEIIEAGRAQIPTTSRLYADLATAIEICGKYHNSFDAFEEIITDLHLAFGHYDPVHTNNNAAVCAAALLVAKGDFHRGITFAVMCGWDTDCNGATVGSIIGILRGAQNLPAKWTGPLNDRLLSLIPGYHPIPISECANRSVKFILQHATADR